MDIGTILDYAVGYIAAMGGVFLLYLPVIILLVCLPITAGILQLMLLPFIALFKKVLRRQPNLDPSWFLERQR